MKRISARSAPSRRSNRRELPSNAGLRTFRSPRRKPAGTSEANFELDIDENRKLLNRYRFILHQEMHILSGWMPKVRNFELKCEFGRTIWEGALHVNSFYLRLREIQSPAFQNPSDPPLVAMFSELLNAPDEYAVALAFYRVITPKLLQALEDHENATFPNSDQPSVHAIKHAQLDLNAQLARVVPLLEKAASDRNFSASTRAWEKYVSELLNSAGGVTGRDARHRRPPTLPAGRTVFIAPKEAERDERFTNRFADLEKMPSEDDYSKHTVEEFERYSTEMLAAETVALVMFSLPNMPWEFQFDTARHLYDEVRHCLMGYEWMRRHGLDPFKSPQFLHIYKWRSRFPPVTQYCMLTMGNEVNAFPYRHRRVKAHQESGDRISEQFVRYDIADETQHVRFGKRWLPELLRTVGEKRSLKQFIDETMEIWKAQYLTGKLSINVE